MPAPFTASQRKKKSSTAGTDKQPSCSYSPALSDRPSWIKSPPSTPSPRLLLNFVPPFWQATSLSGSSTSYPSIDSRLQDAIQAKTHFTMASAIKSALPSHLKPSAAGKDEGDASFERHHGKTRSAMVSLPLSPCFPLPYTRLLLLRRSALVACEDEVVTDSRHTACGSHCLRASCHLIHCLARRICTCLFLLESDAACLESSLPSRPHPSSLGRIGNCLSSLGNRTTFRAQKTSPHTCLLSRDEHTSRDQICLSQCPCLKC